MMVNPSMIYLQRTLQVGIVSLKLFFLLQKEASFTIKWQY